VGQKDGVGDLVAQTNNIADLDTLAGLRCHGSGRENLPVVVGVVVGVSSDLLSLRGDTAIVVSQRVAVYVTVEVDFGLLVA